MNLSTTLALLAPTLVGVSVAVVSLTELEAAYGVAVERAAEVQQLNDAQTLKAARLAYALEGGPIDASEAELVARGYLEPEWLTRERVDTSPLELPEVTE